MISKRVVIVLRPEPGNAATVARLAHHGISAVAAPLFAIEPVAWVPPSTAGFDALLLTSANAVRMAGHGLDGLRSLPVWCVGTATETAARDAGLMVTRVGSAGVAELIGGGSEDLLWLCGEQRSVLPQNAEAQVRAIPVYRSRDLPFSTKLVSAPCIVMLHSPRAARRLAALVQRRDHIALVAISAEVAAAAGGGWGSIAMASRPEDAEMVAIAAELCQKQG